MAGPNRAEAGRSKSSPMVVMLMVRGARPASRSGRCSAARLMGYVPEVDSNTPPERCRQAPVSAGSPAISRTALPPPCARCRP